MWIYSYVVAVLLSLHSGLLALTKDYAIQSAIETQLRDIISSYEISEEDVGIYIKSLSTGRVIYEKNSNRLFIPASNQKIITTVSALLILGPDFRFETKFLTDGSIDRSVLKGNVYIVGNFNPEIDQSYYEDFVRFLKYKGIQKIDGDIVAFSSFFSSPKGWPERDSQYCFTPLPSDLPISENCLKVRILSKNGVKIEIIPNMHLDIVSDLKPSKANSDVSLKLEGTKLFITGYIRSRHSQELSVPIKEPAIFNLLTLSKLLHLSGIEYSNLYISNTLPPNLHTLYSKSSSPLRDIIKKANKDSNNFIAEQLFAYLGKESILRFLERNRLSFSQLTIYDGSGLSRYNTVSPKVLGEILEFVYKTPYFEDFFKSLAISGKDGTLKHRFSEPEMFGKIYAKTGYIKGVKNLSGYAISVDGDVYIFSILVNNLGSTKPANDIQEKVCKILVNSAQFSKRY